MAGPRSRLSQRAYAAHRKELGLTGGTHQAVAKAIATGRLTARSVERRGKRFLIDPELADVEWARSTTAAQMRDPEVISEARAAAVEREETGELDLFGEPTLRAKSADPAEGQAGAQTTKADADRLLTTIRAQLLMLDLKERAGDLVRKDEVTNEVVSIFRRVRDELLQLPERVADIVAAESDPLAVRELISEEITATLSRLAHAVERS